MIEYVIWGVLIPLVTLVLLALFEPEFAGLTMCKYLHWHKPDGMRSGGFGLIKSICKYCGKSIMLDSQGNWF